MFSELQKTGIALGLTSEQVRTSHFGSHTLTVIRAEMRMNGGLQEAFEKYQGLDKFQVRGVFELGLNREQVLESNFGPHTIIAIKAELARNVGLQEAFEKYQGLDKFQVRGVFELGLNREQVLESNFGPHTIIAIKAELAKNVGLQEAFEKYKDLNKFQVEGMSGLGLNREQVQFCNFGPHTITAIEAELAKNVGLQEAFEKYKDLNKFQVEGMTGLGLNREQVQAHNFGFHTITAIRAEIGKNVDLQQAFEKYKGLNSFAISAPRSDFFQPPSSDNTPSLPISQGKFGYGPS